MNPDASNPVRAFQQALRAYARYNQRQLGPLIESRARRMRFALYRQFKAIAPSPQRIHTEAASRGYAIRRRKERSGRTLTTDQELAARKRSRGWLSASWIHRQWVNRQSGQSGTFKALGRTGGTIGLAQVRTALGQPNPAVRLTSLLAGAAIQNQRRALVSAALHSQIADLRAYTARKQRQQLVRLARALSG